MRDPSFDNDGHGDDNDEHEENTTRPPFDDETAEATPGPSSEQIEMTLMNKEKDSETTAETSFTEDDPSVSGLIHEDDRSVILERALNFIRDRFPKVNFGKIDPIGFSKKSKYENLIASLGPKGGETEMFKKDGIGLLKSFLDKNKEALGPMAEDEIRRNLREAEKQPNVAEKFAAEKEKAVQEVQNLTNKIEQTQAQIDAGKQNQCNPRLLLTLNCSIPVYPPPPPVIHKMIKLNTFTNLQGKYSIKHYTVNSEHICIFKEFVY